MPVARRKGSIDDFLVLPPGPPPAPTPNAPGFVSTAIHNRQAHGGPMITGAATTAQDVTGPNVITRKVRDLGKGIVDRNRPASSR